VHARDDNGARDLCEGPAHARLDALLASGQAWSRPLACVHAEGRDAWMAADAPPGALRLARVHVEDAWGAAADADLLLDAATATPPVRHPTTAPSRRAADLLP
jgi:hypothetical protein